MTDVTLGAHTSNMHASKHAESAVSRACSTFHDPTDRDALESRVFRSQGGVHCTTGNEKSMEGVGFSGTSR